MAQKMRDKVKTKEIFGIIFFHTILDNLGNTMLIIFLPDKNKKYVNQSLAVIHTYSYSKM